MGLWKNQGRIIPGADGSNPLKYYKMVKENILEVLLENKLSWKIL